MQLKQLYADDDRAVSPVIGVILMVAITVILAAVIATFVLGLGESVSDTAPQASFDFTPSDDAIVMTGGDEIESGNLDIKIGSSSNELDSGTTVTAGTDLMQISGAPASYGASDTVRVVWTNPDGGNTAVIGSYNT